jgi:hypothetical protein
MSYVNFREATDVTCKAKEIPPASEPYRAEEPQRRVPREYPFIELDPVTAATECTSEMEKPTGERMRARGACSVTELAKEFLR